MLKKWLNLSHGLELLPNINQGRRNNENGIMYFSQLLVLKQHNGTIIEEDKALFKEVCLNIRAYKLNGDRVSGVFDRGQGESLNQTGHVRKISHDNLTAISRTSNDLNLKFHKAIAKNMISNHTRFDNAQVDNPRFILKSHDGKNTTSCQLHPRDWFYWFYMGGYKSLAMLFYPIFILATLLTCFGDLGETSGKNLIWTKLLGRKELPLKLLWEVCNFILKKRYKTDNWIKITTATYYWQSEENPIRLEADKLSI